jgi:hypothetical protein
MKSIAKTTTAVSKTAKLETFLKTGATVTAKQITSRFGLKNPHEAIRQLRQDGVCVYSNATTLSDGTKATKYRIGTPSKAMVAAAARLAGAELFA